MQHHTALCLSSSTVQFLAHTDIFMNNVIIPPSQMRNAKENTDCFYTTMYFDFPI